MSRKHAVQHRKLQLLHFIFDKTCCLLVLHSIIFHHGVSSPLPPLHPLCGDVSVFLVSNYNENKKEPWCNDLFEFQRASLSDGGVKGGFAFISILLSFLFHLAIKETRARDYPPPLLVPEVCRGRQRGQEGGQRRPEEAKGEERVEKVVLVQQLYRFVFPLDYVGSVEKWVIVVKQLFGFEAARHPVISCLNNLGLETLNPSAPSKLCINARGIETKLLPIWRAASFLINIMR